MHVSACLQAYAFGICAQHVMCWSGPSKASDSVLLNKAEYMQGSSLPACYDERLAHVCTLPCLPVTIRSARRKKLLLPVNNCWHRASAFQFLMFRGIHNITHAAWFSLVFIDLWLRSHCVPHTSCKMLCRHIMICQRNQLISSVVNQNGAVCTARAKADNHASRLCGDMFTVGTLTVQTDPLTVCS